MIAVDGKFFSLDGERFTVHGVTYGTFAPRDPDGYRFPSRSDLAVDFELIRDAGFNVVRTYTSVPDDLLGQAGLSDLRILAGVHWNDWRYLIGSSRRQRAAVARSALAEVRREAKRLAGHPDVLALSVGNEIPADVVRWVGAEYVSHLIDELAHTVHEEDPDRLVTYANYPSTEYITASALDFITYNIYLDRPADLRRYLTRLHNLVGESPLVIGELGFHADSGVAGDAAQALSLDDHLAVALERGVAGTCLFAWTDDWHVGDTQVEGWQFGLTRRDRSSRPALDVARTWNHRTVADLTPSGGWPSIAVVICA